MSILKDLLNGKCPVPLKRDRWGSGAQLKRYFLFGKPRPVARELHWPILRIY